MSTKMFRVLKGQKRNRPSNGTFDVQDTANVKHTRLGIWDMYEQKNPKVLDIPGVAGLESRLEILNDLPYVWRMLKDVLSIRSCWIYLVMYLVIEMVQALIPAVTLWYSGQFLNIIQTAIDERTVDKKMLLYVSMGRMTCNLVARILEHARQRVEIPVKIRIKNYYSMHIFSSMARLDVPTFEDPLIQRRLEDATPGTTRQNSIAWETVRVLSGLGSTAVRLVSQLFVLVSVLRDQRDGPVFAIVHFAQILYSHYQARNSYPLRQVTAWAATTNDQDYIRVQGMKRVVSDGVHRKELVAGNLKQFLITQFREATIRMADDAADFQELLRRQSSFTKISFSAMMSLPLHEFPQIVYTLRAAQYPKSIPMSITSMRLIQDTTREFMHIFVGFLDSTGSIAERLHSVRQLYEIENIPNKVIDGTVPFPENRQSLRSGISVEFRNVSFQYPDSGNYALKDVSFKIEKGQLCVLVGSNGSGKSTILKLIMRLYNPTSGQILIDDHDITTLKLADLRQTISVLFQDYTHFPLTIKENIALGDPSQLHDENKIREAARLGGAETFIDKLPEGFDTYLDRPVRDYYSNIPEGTKTLFGRPVDFSGVRSMMDRSGSINAAPLSGGQMQRLAVSRTFMRSVLSDEEKVGLLLFDEPSASLDPQAEHDLFTRLRHLRGEKTMLFSSHRFGQLTRHSDIILYMNDSVIVETGTHDELIKRGGKYAGLWNLQAQAFL